MVASCRNTQRQHGYRSYRGRFTHPKISLTNRTRPARQRTTRSMLRSRRSTQPCTMPSGISKNTMAGYTGTRIARRNTFTNYAKSQKNGHRSSTSPGAKTASRVNGRSTGGTSRTDSYPNRTTTASPTTIPHRRRKNEIDNIPGPTRNLLRGLGMERSSTAQENNICQMTSKGSSRAMAGPLRRRKTRRRLGNMTSIRGNPQATFWRRGCQGYSAKQDHGHHPKCKNDDRICERIQNASSRN